MIVITRIVRNDKKEIAFVSPYCVFDGDINEANDVCIGLKNKYSSESIEYFAIDVDVRKIGDFLL